MMRVVFVTEDWMPFHRSAWSASVPQKESEVLRFYEATIWEETKSVHLYALPNDFDPTYAQFERYPPAHYIALREQHAISVHHGMPAQYSVGRSAFLRRAFEDFASILVERHPDAEHHLTYHGHGAAGGYLFAYQMRPRDADRFLTTWTSLLGRPLGVIDMGGPCNKGGYDDLANFCQHSRFYVASDLPNGGFEMDEWTTMEHFTETIPEVQYHRLFASTDTLEEALKERVALGRLGYEYSIDTLTEKRWPQANYLYSCAAFNQFKVAFERFVDDKAIRGGSEDLYQLMLDNTAPPELMRLFFEVFLYRADNRDFFEWNVVANGMIRPYALH